MKKIFFLLVFASINYGFAQVYDYDPSKFLAMNSYPSSEDMDKVCDTTAWQWNQIAWFDHSAQVFKNTRDGSLWIKIDIIADPGYVKCRVEKNPDYTGGFKGGNRTYREYMAVGNGITYYFDID